MYKKELNHLRLIKGESDSMKASANQRNRHEVTSWLRDDPFVDEELRLLGEAEEELALDLHRVDRLHGFVDLVVQALDLLKWMKMNEGINKTFSANEFKKFSLKGSLKKDLKRPIPLSPFQTGQT